ncbi:hypothetical protein KC963_04665 [Candidatus Saccharibacteria bacterium]|nr:hypothetical protein [Candidatus Saccharibacteria bacterium]
MAWYNPATWAVVNQLQGQNNSQPAKSPYYDPSSTVIGNASSLRPVSGPKKSWTNATSDANLFGINAASAGGSSTGGYSTSGGSSGGSGGTSYDPAAVALYDQAIGQANAGLGRLGSQEGIGIANVEGDFNNNLQRLLSAKNRTQQQYEGNKVTSTQDNLQARSDIDFATGQRANALKRLLGARGAGSSSASRVAAPYAAALEGTQQLNDVADTFAKNMGALDKSWGDYNFEWDQNKNDLEAQKVNAINAVKSEVANKRVNLLNTLAQLNTQRQQALGGSAGATVAAAQPYLNQVNDIYGQIDNLGRQFQGRVNVADPTYSAPDLSAYTYDPRNPVGFGGNQNAQAEAVSPYLSLLLNAKKKEQ